jgi:hypothetical protein
MQQFAGGEIMGERTSRRTTAKKVQQQDVGGDVSCQSVGARQGVIRLPGFVQSHLDETVKKTGLTPEQILTYHIMNSYALLTASTHLLGEPLVNPFVLVSNWGELHCYLYESYIDFLYDFAMSMPEKPPAKAKKGKGKGKK